MGSDADGAGAPSRRDARTDRRPAGEPLATRRSGVARQGTHRSAMRGQTPVAAPGESTERATGGAQRPEDAPARPTVTPAALYLTRIAYLEARVESLEGTVEELEATVDELEAAVSAAERDRQRVIDRYERLLREARRGDGSAEADGPLGVSRAVADLLR